MAPWLATHIFASFGLVPCMHVNMPRDHEILGVVEEDSSGSFIDASSTL